MKTNPYERHSDLQLTCGADSWPLIHVHVGPKLLTEGNVCGVTFKFGADTLEECEYRFSAIKDSLFMEIKCEHTTIRLRPYMCDLPYPQVGKERSDISFDSTIHPLIPHRSNPEFPAHHYVTGVWETETVKHD